jgi:oxygen-independent coproporphyrinogen III oxidase
MCHGTLDIAAFEERHRLDFAAYFSTELVRLGELARDGLITVNPDRLTVSSRGRFLLRIIAMCFDAHLPRPQAVEVRYSKAL